MAAPLAVAVVAFALARVALLPGQGFWDTGEFQTVPPLLGTAHPTGYPSYVLLGWMASIVLLPAGEPALRMNLLSALLFGGAAGLVVVLVRALARRTAVAMGAGLLFVLTPIPWRMGTFADPHTLHVALIALLLVLLAGWERRRRAGAGSADRWLVASGIAYGVMLGNHTLTVLLAPGIALFVLVVEPRIMLRPRLLGLCAAAVVGTAAVLYLELPIRAAMGAPIVYGHPDTWDGFWYVLLAEQFRGDLVQPFADLGDKVAALARLAFQQLGPIAALIPAAFLVVAVRQPRFALLTATWLGVTCWFAASYTNASIDRYYLGPALVVVAWLGIAAGLVVDALEALVARPARDDPPDTRGAEARTTGGLRTAIIPAVSVILAAALLAPAALAAPGTVTTVDLSRDERAADWSRWALANADERAVIVSWWSFSTPLWYRTAVLLERPDVTVIDDRDRLDLNLGSLDDVIRSNLATRPVYLVRYPREIADVETRWRLEELRDPLGLQSIYRVIGPRTGGTAPVNGRATASGNRQVAAARMRA